MAMSMTAASAVLWQNFMNRVTHAAKTRPIDAAFMPTSVQRTRACRRADSARLDKLRRLERDPEQAEEPGEHLRLHHQYGADDQLEEVAAARQVRHDVEEEGAEERRRGGARARALRLRRVEGLEVRVAELQEQRVVALRPVAALRVCARRHGND